MICTLFVQSAGFGVACPAAPPLPFPLAVYCNLSKIPARPPTDSVSRGCSRTVEQLNATHLLPTFSLPSCTYKPSRSWEWSTPNMLSSILCLDRTTKLGWSNGLYVIEQNLRKNSLIYSSWNRFYKKLFEN